jgi:hypothetical protein
VAQQPYSGLGRVIVEVSRLQSDTAQSVELLWTKCSGCRRDLYLTTHNTHEWHPRPRWDSNPQSQQEKGRRPTPYTARAPGSETVLNNLIKVRTRYGLPQGALACTKVNVNKWRTWSHAPTTPWHIVTCMWKFCDFIQFECICWCMWVILLFVFKYPLIRFHLMLSQHIGIRFNRVKHFIFRHRNFKF